MRLSVPLILIFLTGCITSSYYKSNNDYRSARNEFDSSGKSAFRIIEGRWTGIRDTGGERQHILLFSDILKGSNRTLEVTVPLDGIKDKAFEKGEDGVLRKTGKDVIRPGHIRFSESRLSLSGSHPAYFIFEPYVKIGMKSFYTLFNLNVGSRIDPAVIFKESFNYELRDPVYPLILVRLDFSLNYRYSARAIVWEKGEDGKPFVSSVGLSAESYDDPHLAIEWEERSRFVYILRHGGYAGTVIADIITSPIQALGYLWLIITGPGAR